MKKKSVYICCGIILLFIVVTIFLELGQRTGSSGDGDMMSVKNARKNITKMLEKGRNGEYRNLEFEEFMPFMTDENVVYATTGSYVSDSVLTEEQFQTQLDWMKAFFGEDVSYSDTRINSFDGITAEEQLAQIRSGQDSVPVLLLYIHDEDYAQIAQNHLWIDMGFKGIVPDLESSDKVYYAGSTDGSLDDVYRTASGELTVREAIQQVETYFNVDFPIGPSPVYQYNVFEVFVIEKEDGTTQFVFGIRAAYKGVPCEWAISGTTAYGEMAHIELMQAVLEDENKVTFFNGMGYLADITENEAIKEIVSPDAAMSAVAEHIGEQSVYQVWGMELGYCEKALSNERNEWESEPNWIVYTTNKTNDRETRFYVDVQTKEVSARVM